MSRSITKALLLYSLLFVAVLLFFKYLAAAEPNFTVEQVAYLKINNNRIFIYEYEGLPSDKEIAQYFLIDHPPRNTEGRFTAAYIWPAGNKKPLSDFNTIQSITAANDFLYNSQEIDKWEFAYMKSFDGNAGLVSCVSTPHHELCRK